MKLELLDDQGFAIQAEAVADRLHLTTDLMGGDGVMLTHDQVAQLVAFMNSWLARPRGPHTRGD